MSNQRVTQLFAFLLIAILGFWLGFVVRLLRLHSEPTDIKPLLFVQIDDVGDGDAAFLNAPGGLAVQVDAGPDQAAAAQIILQEHRLQRKPPKLIVLTSVQPDSIGGLPYLLSQWSYTGPIILPCSTTQFVRLAGTTGTAIVAAANQSGAPLYSLDQAESNQTLQRLLSSQTSSTTCQVTLVPIGNETGDMALRIDYNEGSMVYAAGLTPQDQDQLIAQRVNLNCDVLAASGDPGSLSSEFLALTQPSVVTLSDSQESPPDEQVLGRVRASDATIGRTDMAGSITLGISPDPDTTTQFFTPDAILAQAK